MYKAKPSVPLTSPASLFSSPGFLLSSSPATSLSPEHISLYSRFPLPGTFFLLKHMCAHPLRPCRSPLHFHIIRGVSSDHPLSNSQPDPQHVGPACLSMCADWPRTCVRTCPSLGASSCLPPRMRAPGGRAPSSFALCSS